MKLVTFNSANGSRVGILGNDDSVFDVSASGFTEAADMLALIQAGPAALAALRQCYESERGRSELWHAADTITLLAPIPQMRKNVFCVGRNYKFHIEESARAKGIDVSYPKVPEFFSKPASAVIGTEAGIRRNATRTEKLDYEVELGIVIGTRLLDADPETAHAGIFGYTIINDISARDLQTAHGQWFKGKALDTFCPIGPCIVTADEFGDPTANLISLCVNGEIRQDSSTSDLLFGIPQIVSALSAGLTLDAGDMIATGTPAGVAFGMETPAYLQVGDLLEAKVDGIGILRNPIID
jgi:2-keto-4-pentenoate hydratase/2-oxohepta-3-ene-1,7-dioic acid hydratase in catechol pathway